MFGWSGQQDIGVWGRENRHVEDTNAVIGAGLTWRREALRLLQEVEDGLYHLCDPLRLGHLILSTLLGLVQRVVKSSFGKRPIAFGDETARRKGPTNTVLAASPEFVDRSMERHAGLTNVIHVHDIHARVQVY